MSNNWFYVRYVIHVLKICELCMLIFYSIGVNRTWLKIELLCMLKNALLFK